MHTLSSSRAFLLIVGVLGAAGARAQACPILSAADCPAGSNIVLGSAAGETLTGTDPSTTDDGADCILGFDGNDTINGLGGNDIICGGLGNDTITAGNGDDTLYGDGGDDNMTGGGGTDVLFGGDGSDTMDGGAGPDQIFGNAGNDTLTGSGGNDFLDGGTGTNSLSGQAGTDVCINGTTNSTCESTTPVTLRDFSLHRIGAGLRVTWSTDEEAGVLSYQLRRRGPDGVFRATGDVVPVMHDAPLGGTYRVRDATPARLGERVAYDIVARGNGLEVVLGPAEAIVTAASDLHAPAREARRMSPAPARAEARHRSHTQRGPSASLKIGVTTTGIHRISAAELASHLGAPAATVRQWLSSGALRLTVGEADPVDGERQSVRWWSPPLEPAFVFYGLAPSSSYSAERVYFLSVGSGSTGSTMQRSSVRPPGRAAAAAAFDAVVAVEENRFAGLVVEPDPERDYFFWSVLMSGVAGYEAFTARLPVDELASSSEPAVLRLGIHGAARGTHQVALSLNGVPLGTRTFSGATAAVIEQPFDAALLADGDNVVEARILPRTIIEASIAYVDRVELTYPRHYVVIAGQLAFKASGPVTVASDDALLFDVNDPAAPTVVTGARTSPGALSFYAPSGARRYVAVERDGFAVPSWVQGDAASSWRDEDNAAEYVIIAPAEHIEEATRLAALRADSGLSVAVVDVEDLYDEFGDGAPSPHAIHAFLAHAVAAWSVPPRFVALAGAASYDHRDVLGYGESLVPTFMVRTGNGLFASDTRLADVVGDDGLADLAIGRLPARSAAELAVLVDKIERYESAGTAGGTLSLVAERRDGAADFGATADSLFARVPSWNPARIYQDALGVAATRAGTRAAFGDAAIVGYLGHGSVAVLGRDHLLGLADVPALPATDTPPLLLAMTCTLGRFELAGFDGLAEALLQRPDGGAIAVLAASSLSAHEEATRLLDALLVNAASTARLGDAVLAAQSQLYASSAQPADPTLLLTYNLLGDPALAHKVSGAH